MNNDYKEQYAANIASYYQSLELRIMEDIARRIQKTGEITSTADYQINRLQILGYSSEDIEKELKKALDASYPQMFELYDKVIEKEYTRNKAVYEQINAKFIPFEENHQLQQITDAIMLNAIEDLQNISGSLGFYLDYGNGKRVITPLAEIYQGYLDNACMDIVTGAFDYNTVLRRVVSQLTNSGLRVIDYASGWHNRVEVAARRAVMTGVSQVTGRIAEYNAASMGTEYFEVAWHAGARPTHAVWQGKVWSEEELYSVCGLGTVTGLLGANCYHEYYPFFPGISERNWTDEWLEQKNLEESTPKTFKGKEYTVYQAKQRQRQMETAMRAQREKVQLLKKAGADRDEITLQKAKYQGQLDEYAQFSRKMGLSQERERIYMDGRGKVATNTKSQNSMFHPEMVKNASKDVAQYKRYKSVFGDSMVSLAEFGRIKYNDAEVWELFKRYTSSVEKGMISPLSGYQNYINIYRDIEKSVVGIETADSIEIKEQSKHFIERVIGTMEDPKTKNPRSGVAVEDIKNALTNPLDISSPFTNHEGKTSMRYIGEKATVTVNPDTGVLIQCNPTTKQRGERLKNGKV